MSGEPEYKINGIDAIYWINLDRSPDRTENMLDLFQDDAFLKVPTYRFSAVDGKSDNIDNLIDVKEKTITDGEYGCLLSHLEIMREFSKSNYDVALILEDDTTLEFKPYWKKDLKDVIANAPSDWEIIMLCYISNDIPKDEYTYNKNQYWSTLAYVINRPGATRIINDIYRDGKYHLESEINNEADQYIFQKVRTYVYKYSYFIYKYGETSTLHQRAVSRHDLSRQRIENMLMGNETDNVSEGFTSKINESITDSFEYFMNNSLFILLRLLILLLLLLILFFIMIIHLKMGNNLSKYWIKIWTK